MSLGIYEHLRLSCSSLLTPPLQKTLLSRFLLQCYRCLFQNNTLYACVYYKYCHTYIRGAAC